MNCNILGNGPSRHLWDGSGFSIGCNFAEDTTCLCVTDRQFVHGIKGGVYKPKKGVILGPHAWREAQQVRIFNKAKIIGFVQSDESESDCVKNAGQAATEWAFAVGFEEVDLWGFDSLWTGSRETTTDSILEKVQLKPSRRGGEKTKKAPMEKWNKGWASIRRKFPNRVINVHLPAGETLIRSPYRFVPVHHEPS